MFKIFAVFSLLTLLAEGGSQQSSPWPVLIAMAVICSVLIVAFFWLRGRYRIVRRAVSGRFSKRGAPTPVIGKQAWKKIESGEMARKLIGKEGSK